MQVLLIFTREDPQIVTLRNAILKCGYSPKCCKNIEETHEAFKKVNYDLVFIDCRRAPTNISSTNLKTSQQTQTLTNQYDYENICRFIRKLFHYTVVVALTNNLDDRETPGVLPYLKAGFNKTFTETTNLNRCINELLTLEYGEVSNVRRLQSSHVLFTALEYTSDPIEIMNDQFKLLYVNNAFEKLTGFSLNDVSGQDFSHIHQMDSFDLLSKQITQGNACEYETSIQKPNGEFQNCLSVTIPVTLQGEINKIQNYVTITNVSDKQIHFFKNKKVTPKANEDCSNGSTGSVTAPGLAVGPVKTKITSLNLPSRRSYDFERFALVNMSNFSDEQIKEARSGCLNHLPLILQSYPINSSDDNASIAYTDDEKLSSSNQLANEITRSFPEFQRDMINSNSVQRKRSYDVQSANNNFECLPRRHSTARVHGQTVEAPIRKVINIICLAHEKSTTEIVRQNLDKALDILRSTELYNPATLDNDKHTNDLVSGLMSNGLQRKIAKATIIGSKPLSSIQSHNFVKNLSPEVTTVLETDKMWSFDIISLERLTNKRPLITLGLKIMNRFDVCDYLKIDEAVLVNWLTLIESNYKATNPYHNSTHASDVLHATAYFLSTDRLAEILDAGDKVASLIAAAIHDLNHPGRTNAFLCNSDNDLAILYNDQAVLENHHAALAFQLTRQNEDANIFKNLSRDEYRTLRSIIIDMVLATEMNKHFEHLNKFVNKFFIISEEEKTPIKNAEFLKATENKFLIKRILIKCADVSNPCRPLDIYKEWANRIASEYFEQTDEEKLKSLPVVMPTFDRLSCSIPKAQISFIEYFITDMFEAWDDFVDIPEVMSNLQANSLYWRECAEAQQQSQSQETNLNRNESIKEDSETEIDNNSSPATPN